MALELSELKNELAHFGAENDAREVERGRRMLNITPDTGEFLAVLVRFGTARRVLEIGTSNGYSTLWLAEAADAINGHVTTLEYAEDKAAMARDTFARSGLADRITLVHDDAGPWLAEAADASIDLLFLDSDRGQYAGWWPQLRRVLRPGGLLVVDNATSHAGEMEPLRVLLDADPDFSTSLVPVGNGELLAVRNA
ncbi:TPA: O-methyltransferase [Stenotrophomonas maltophilia]|jgi:predicted O-methyltransferase YrrM|uniref:O-methyltransferase n=1 Tax=Stenotrophomonas TaxID=40323 RepID=UPI000977B392|nr:MULTISPECIES: O-methyltransferase [Stenotrophomonas]MCV4212379.1 O-methyltransferase [Pseudomonas cichorii]MBA0240705.1 O-methyltransferase [Stenotrophomonas maltophilia]MBH1429269.1 O-methyltransferase [Stenotrophomonas maltophilia]MBH1598602.1 O-methyltransferase [Stenotrophomonas maltophilia]MBN5086312.1 O-methyltransferase [Stenotrophomonas maltophilia]